MVNEPLTACSPKAEGPARPAASDADIALVAGGFYNYA
jgi:hypothetical protein